MLEPILSTEVLKTMQSRPGCVISDNRDQRYMIRDPHTSKFGQGRAEVSQTTTQPTRISINTICHKRQPPFVITGNTYVRQVELRLMAQADKKTHQGNG